MTKFDNNGRTTKVGKKLNNRLFLACIFAGDFKIWKEYDLLKDLEGTVVKGMPNRIVERDEIVLLKIPILNSEGAFVRERLYTTRRYGDAIMPGAVNNYDDMMNSFGLNMASEAEIDFVGKLWEKYDESSVPVKNHWSPLAGIVTLAIDQWHEINAQLNTSDLRYNY